MPDRDPVDSNPLPAASLTRLFRTLSDETRLRLLRLLIQHELTVNELASVTQLAQPRISNHLKILREEDLILERRVGSWRHYRVDSTRMEGRAGAWWQALQTSISADESFAADDKRLARVLEDRARQVPGSFFDDLAHRWDSLRQSLFGDAIGRSVLQAFLPPGLVVADVGTGTGYMLEVFGPKAGALIAIDQSEKMLAMARSKATGKEICPIDFRLADIQRESPLALAEADVLVLVQVLHHLEDPQAALARLTPGLKPGGLLILSDFLSHSELWLREQLQHRWLGFEQVQVLGWLEALGYRDVQWDVLPGRRQSGEEGESLLVPDSFVVVARTVPLP